MPKRAAVASVPTICCQLRTWAACCGSASPRETRCRHYRSGGLPILSLLPSSLLSASKNKPPRLFAAAVRTGLRERSTVARRWDRWSLARPASCLSMWRGSPRWGRSCRWGCGGHGPQVECVWFNISLPSLGCTHSLFSLASVSVMAAGGGPVFWWGGGGIRVLVGASFTQWTARQSEEDC